MNRHDRNHDDVSSGIGRKDARHGVVFDQQNGKSDVWLQRGSVPESRQSTTETRIGQSLESIAVA